MEKKIKRHRQGSNLCGQSPLEFKSNSLTNRTQGHMHMEFLEVICSTAHRFYVANFRKQREKHCEKKMKPEGFEPPTV